MKAALAKQAEKYINRFGILPQFKAGLHFGKVTAGEIGSLKKEIIFTGDVLNTSARIQALCNQFNTDLLVSADLVKVLQLATNYKIKSVRAHLLKGRSTEMELFEISVLK